MAFNPNIPAYSTQGKSFSRTAAFPLEGYEIWTDLEALKAYAANTDPAKDPSYIGQKVAYIDTENNKVVHYGIEIDGSLKELGADKMGVEQLTVDDALTVPMATKVVDSPAVGEEGDEDYQPEVAHIEIRWFDRKYILPPNFGIDYNVWELETGNADEGSLGTVLTLTVNEKEVNILEGENVSIKETTLAGPSGVDWNGQKAIEISAVDTQYHLEYNSDTKEIKLVAGANDNKMVIDATDFVADGVLESVELVDADAEGTAGKFLKFTWNDEGKDVIYIPLNDFIDAYTAGADTSTAKVTIDDDNKITVDVKVSTEEGNSLVAKEDGLYVNAPVIDIPDLVIKGAVAAETPTTEIVTVLKAIEETAEHEITPTTISVATEKAIDSIKGIIGTYSDEEEGIVADGILGDIENFKKEAYGTYPAEHPEYKGQRFINSDEINKLAALDFSGDDIVISGTIVAENVKGLYDSIVNIITKEDEQDLDPWTDGAQVGLKIERGAQKNKIEQVALPDGVLNPVDKQINIPAAMLGTYGVIKGGDPETPNVVSIGEDGIGKVEKVSTDSLVQGTKELVLFGGKANGFA